MFPKHPVSRPVRGSAMLLGFFVGATLMCGPTFGLDDLVEPWGTANGNNFGTAAATGIEFSSEPGEAEEAWRLDVRAEGHDRVAGRNPITFDEEGNIYWKSSTGGGTEGVSRVVSVDPEGQIRWFGNDGGELHGLGAFDSTGVVIGKDAAYAVGGHADGFCMVVAYDKEDGSLLWDSLLEESIAPDASQGYEALTPVLHAGKIYVVACDSMKLTSSNVYQVDAETGDQDWFTPLDDIVGRAAGQATLIPDVFGPDEHGLYFNLDSGSGADGLAEVYAIRLLEDTAELAWGSEGGKVARSHLIYSDVTGNLYAHTWTDYDAELYVYDPVVGTVLGANNNALNSGHGFFDVGCLDFDGTELIVGGFDGHLIRYLDDGSGVTTDSEAYPGETWWGEYRVYGQLIESSSGDSVLVSGTNSRSDTGPEFTARVVAINVTTGVLLWEFDTGIIQDHGYTIRGGPVAGPDGKVYYFDAVSGELVAIRPPSPSRPSQFIRGDANCGGTIDLSDGVYIFNFLFLGGPPPCCEEVANANDDENLADITDGIYILNHLFLGGDAPPAPYPECGPDPNSAECPDYLPCQ